jgi:hypothetical protein
VLLVFLMMLPKPFNYVTLGLLPLIFLLYFFGKLQGGKDFGLTALFSFLVPGLGVAYTGNPIKGLALHLLQWVSCFISLHLGDIPPFDVKIIKFLFGIYFVGQLFFTVFDYKRKYGDIKSLWKLE